MIERVEWLMCSYLGREKEGGVMVEGRVKPEASEEMAPELF